MKKRTIWTKIGDFLEGKGFYIVLALCVAAIGGSGYYLYRMISLSDQLATQSVSAQAQVPADSDTAQNDTEQAVQNAVNAAAEQAAAAQKKAQEKTQAAIAQQKQESDPTKNAQGDQDLEAAPSKNTQTQEKTETKTESTQQDASTGKKATGTPASWTWPVTGEVAEGFSTKKLSYNQALEDWRAHTGVDITAQVGDVVASATDGTVVSVKEDVMLGQTVTVQTADKLQLTYGNLAKQPPVQSGDKVKAGQTIGNVGKTAAGEQHDKAWLHFSVEKDGKAVNPMDYLTAKK